MRRRGTGLLLLGVTALALAAGYDALRGEGGGGEREARAPAPPAPPSRPPEIDERNADALRERGIAGTLLYANEECEVRRLVLPTLSEDAVRGEACAFTAATSRDGTVALCSSGMVDVHRGSRFVGRTRGCAPAWRPSGSLTVVRDGEVVEPDLGHPGRRFPAHVLISRSDLGRDLTGSPWAFLDPRIREAAWLAEDLAAVVVSDPGREDDDVLALYRNGRFVGGPPFPYERLSGLRVSPRGSFVAARVGLPVRGLVLVDRRGDIVGIPFRIGRAITWSPDEAWTAVASPDTVFIWETGERAVRFVPLPIRARDLLWD